MFLKIVLVAPSGPIYGTPCTPTTTSTTTTPAPTTTPPCTPGGEWSEWSTAACNDTCGLCGSIVSTRTCLSEANGCPCDGDAEDVGEHCGDPSCPFPRTACCSWAKRKLSGQSIICVLS